jgi:hypothetical protein
VYLLYQRRQAVNKDMMVNQLLHEFLLDFDIYIIEDQVLFEALVLFEDQALIEDQVLLEDQQANQSLFYDPDSYRSLCTCLVFLCIPKYIEML